MDPQVAQQVQAAWVSAAAAVGQAIAAAAAIFYSGKLARDAAKREKEADEAAQRRIADAAAAAAEQRRLDREADEQRSQAAQLLIYNGPIDRALDVAIEGLAGVKWRCAEFARLEQVDAQSRYAVDPDSRWSMAASMLPELEKSMQGGASAASVRSLYRHFHVPEGFQSARDWTDILETKIEAIEFAIGDLRSTRH